MDGATAQAGLFKHLLGASHVNLPGQIQQADPLTPAAIVALVDEGWLTRAEVLSLYAYAHFAARIEPSLALQVEPLTGDFQIPPAFADKCDQVWSAELSKSGALTLEKLLTETPNAIVKAVFHLVVAERMQRRSGKRIRLTGLESIVYQHPTDRAYMAKLAALPLLPTLTAKAVDFLKNADEVNQLGNSIMVTPQSLPAVHHCFSEACEVLDVNPMPPLYVNNGSLGAYTSGADLL